MERRLAMDEKEVEVAYVEDYFAHVGVVALKVTGDEIKVGDTLHFKGHTTDAIVEVSSLQINHKSVKSAAQGEEVGIKVNERVRRHDKVYKVVSQE